MNPVLESGVGYLESLLLQALDWKTLIHCLPAMSPSIHKQLRYHGDLISNSLADQANIYRGFHKTFHITSLAILLLLKKAINLEMSI